VKPVLALVGRPNVGKSTLFNQLTRSRDALVANFPGLTRDRQYGEGKVGDKPFIVIDTGGIAGNETGIDAEMASQARVAIAEADAVLLLVDARAGLQPADQMLVDQFRREERPFYLVVNKIDGLDTAVGLADFHRLGLATLIPIAASHGRGIRQLIETVLEPFPAPAEPDPEAGPERLRVAIVGRPNVGKSTLVNRMLGEDRVVVFDQPGTTRDSVYIDFERAGQHYTLIDTAGVRRRRSVSETVEKFSIVKTLKAIADAHVVVLLIDGKDGLVDQDLHLLGASIEAGRALVLGVNKWDGMAAEERAWLKTEMDRKLQFIDYAQTHYISALHGSGVGDLYPSIIKAYRAATRKLSTPALTRLLEVAVTEHPPPLVNGRRIKLRYAHAGGQNPPLIVIHGNQTERLPASYLKYLENSFRRALKLQGTPIRIELRSGENPFAGKRNELSQRQVQRKRRLMAHVKKDRKR